MSSRVNNDGGIVMKRVFRPAKVVKSADGATRPFHVSTGTGGKQAAKTSRARAPADLSKLSESRRPDVDVNEVLGIQDLNARFFIDSRVNRRVVQLRDAESQKLIRQVPTAESLDRMAKLRIFAGKHLDMKI